MNQSQLGQRVVKAGCAVACGVGAYTTLLLGLMFARGKFTMLYPIAAAEAIACLTLAKQALVGPDDGADSKSVD